MPNQSSKNEFFKTISLKFLGEKESIDKVTTQLGSSLQTAFENSPIGKTLSAGFVAHLKQENPLKAMFDTALKEFSKIVNDSLKEMKAMLEFSQLSSSQTRELAFSYGFTGAQSYGFTRAMQAVGVESEEDLMYMNIQEQKQFREAFTKYTKKYEELYDQGFFEQMQEYQYEMQDFKFEMQQEIIEFFMDNKDEIKNVMKTVIWFSEKTIQLLGWIVDILGGPDEMRTQSEMSAKTRDIINSNSVSNKNTNIKIDNTFNNVSKSDQTWLANAGSLTYEQLIRAYGG